MITVITPTFNRAATLPRLYQSLLDQTDKRFDWIVVDDGSTDQTEELVRQWIRECKIPITYLKKENGGKASALNMAFDHLALPYCTCLDSDDYFSGNAIATAMALLEQEEDRQECCGVLALRNNPNGEVMGGRPIPKSYQYVTMFDVLEKLALRTETICFYKTEIIKRYRFPEIEHETFVSPAYLDYELSKNYYFRVSQDSICYCEYIADGLTVNKRRVIADNPRGYTVVIRQAWEAAKSPYFLLKHGIMYDCGCIISKDASWLKNAPHKLLAVLLYPLGYLAYFIRFSKLCAVKVSNKGEK